MSPIIDLKQIHHRSGSTSQVHSRCLQPIWILESHLIHQLLYFPCRQHNQTDEVKWNNLPLILFRLISLSVCLKYRLRVPSTPPWGQMNTFLILVKAMAVEYVSLQYKSCTFKVRRQDLSTVPPSHSCHDCHSSFTRSDRQRTHCATLPPAWSSSPSSTFLPVLLCSWPLPRCSGKIFFPRSTLSFRGLLHTFQVVRRMSGVGSGGLRSPRICGTKYPSHFTTLARRHLSRALYTWRPYEWSGILLTCLSVNSFNILLLMFLRVSH